MSLGIDLYDRYQDVTSWTQLKAAGVAWLYVKGTDGGARAVVAADAFVRGAKSVDLPVGLYHYAQLTPTPEAQADVLADEVARLGATGMPPCLDFESTVANSLTNAQGADFCKRFFQQMRRRGFKRVTLYANTAHLTKVNPDSWSDPDLVIWAARYGTNDGATYPGLGSYTGKVHLHQWTDNGSLPGVSYPVDLNRMLVNILEDTMDLTKENLDAIAAAVAPAVWAKVLTTASGYSFPAAGWLMAANLKVDSLLDDEAKVTAAIQQATATLSARTVTLSDADRQDIADRVVAAKSDAEANAVIDELAERLSKPVT